MVSEISILGGGPAGLAVGYYLTKAGLPLTLFESEDTPGGACRTIQVDDVRSDLGAHRLHNVHTDVTEEIQKLLADDLRIVNVPSRVYCRGKWAKFPLTPLGLIKTLGVGAVAKSTISILFRSAEDADNFQEDAERKYSKRIAKSFLINYSEKLWGQPADTLSPDVSGERLDGLNLRSLMRDLLFRRHSEHLDGAFYYPRYGFGQITDALASRINHIHLSKRATKILHENDRISTIVFDNGEQVNGGRVISTIPITTFLRMLEPAPPEEIIALAETLRFRHVRLVMLVVNRPFVARSASLYFPDKSIPFTRVYEPKNRSVDMSPEDKTALVVEYPYSDGDDIDEMSEKALIENTKRVLESLALVGPEDIIGATDRRIPTAYPILTVDSAVTLGPIMKYIGRFTNLHVIGRSAEFEYTHFHDLMHRGRLLSEEIARDYRSDSASASST